MQSLWMLVAALAFSIMAAFIKWSAGSVGAMEMIAWRGVFGMALLFLWVRSQGLTLRTTLFWSHIKRCILGAVSMWMWFVAISRLPLSTGMTLNYTSPLFMAGITALLTVVRGGRPDLRLTAAVAAGFAGTVLVLQPDVSGSDITAGLIGLGSGFGSALAYFQLRELGQLHEPEWRVVFYFSGFLLLFGVIGHVATEPAIPYTLRSWAAIAGVGVFATIGQLAMTRAFGRGALLLTNIFQFSAIVFAALIGLTLFDDTLNLKSLVGIAIIIVTGVYAGFVTKSRRSRPSGS